MVEKELAVIKTEIVPNIVKNSDMISSLTRRVENMELREKRLNIVIHGLPYEKEESSENLRYKILDFLQINLKTKENAIDIEEWKKIGKWTAQKRPVVVKLRGDEDKQMIFGHVKNLKGTLFGVERDLSFSMRRNKSALLKVRKEAIQEGKLFQNGIIIDGEVLVITDDLSLTRRQGDAKTD
ncbi:unnamed protein product [Allacma fusca]|uniref:Uncharacterized protein n=1 Tax=Allacma fusca TaxID=39272 RepID=A0A8J2K151_9HEXA|nr:unnamed protein product [Allacma fusca]